MKVLFLCLLLAGCANDQANDALSAWISAVANAGWAR